MLFLVLGLAHFSDPRPERALGLASLGINRDWLGDATFTEGRPVSVDVGVCRRAPSAQLAAATDLDVRRLQQAPPDGLGLNCSTRAKPVCWSRTPRKPAGDHNAVRHYRHRARVDRR